jgi:subtilase family serine protease
MPVRSNRPAQLARSRRARLLAFPLLLSAALAAECSPAAATTSGSAAATTWVTTVPTGRTPSDIVTDCLDTTPQGNDPPQCYTPSVLRSVYGVQPLLDRGTDGRGETITVVSPAPSSSTSSPGQVPPAVTDIRQDLAAYDGEFALPPARIEVDTALGDPFSPWLATGEEVGDFEVLHTFAPAATLRVVVLPSDVLQNATTATTDMIAALRLAVSHTDVASISFSLGEHYFTSAQLAQMQSVLSWAAAHHVTVLAASGDSGASSDPRWGTPYKEVSLPASNPLVLGVGGTLLDASPSTGAYISETAMPAPGGRVDGTSGGGFSHLYGTPAYQQGVPGISTTRGGPDVSAAGIGNIPFTFTSDGKTDIIALFGTSGSTPLWAGLVALADQYAHHDLGFINPAIYRIARSPAYHQAFHDVTAGGNTITIGSVTITGYEAGPGWDPVTGWGSPNAQVLIPLLTAARPVTAPFYHGGKLPPKILLGHTSTVTSGT